MCFFQRPTSLTIGVSFRYKYAKFPLRCRRRILATTWGQSTFLLKITTPILRYIAKVFRRWDMWNQRPLFARSFAPRWARGSKSKLRRESNLVAVLVMSAGEILQQRGKGQSDFSD